MKWKFMPDKRQKWDQSKHITKIEDGVCMGMSVEICRHLIKSFNQKRSTKIADKDVYSAIQSLLLSRDQMQKFRSKQFQYADATVPARSSKEMIFQPKTLYLLGLSFSHTGGYFTHLSIMSHLSYWNRPVDHAAILYVGDSSVIIFEPNWGLASWSKSNVSPVNIKMVENLLEGGYHSDGDSYKYAVELMEAGAVNLGKSPKTNMNPKMLA
jgi:hypothetical protein